MFGHGHAGGQRPFPAHDPRMTGRQQASAPKLRFLSDDTARVVVSPGMDVADVAQMTAEALNAMEGRIERDLAELKGDVARLDGKIDASFRVMDQRMDEGFRQVIDHLNKR